MVAEEQAPDAETAADLVFHALADRTRRDILVCVLHRPVSVSALARRYPMSLTAVQKHVGVLEQAGLVTKARQGREQLVHARADRLAEARRLLDQIETLWRHRLAAIADLVAVPESPALGADA